MRKDGGRGFNRFAVSSREARVVVYEGFLRFVLIAVLDRNPGYARLGTERGCI